MQKTILFFLIILGFACSTSFKKTKATANQKHGQEYIKAVIDEKAIAEITGYSDRENKVDYIFDHYNLEEGLEASADNWTERMFGACCTEVMKFSELLYFAVNGNMENEDHPLSYLMDRNYTTAYVFKQGENPEINLQIKLDRKHAGMVPRNVLTSTDTIAYPLTIRLINGYTKSKNTYENNARIKKMKVLLNGDYQSTVELLDIPLIQEFTVDLLFQTNDVLTFVPISSYKGLKYDDVCISEIQSCLDWSAHPSLNEKYQVH